MEKATCSPFMEAVKIESLPTRFKMLHLELYNGTIDPVDHVVAFRALMGVQMVSGPILCRIFPTTLRGLARIGFSRLRRGFVSRFEDLSHAFYAHFFGKRRRIKVSNHLFSIVQKL